MNKVAAFAAPFFGTKYISTSIDSQFMQQQSEIKTLDRKAIYQIQRDNELTGVHNK